MCIVISLGSVESRANSCFGRLFYSCGVLELCCCYGCRDGLCDCEVWQKNMW